MTRLPVDSLNISSDSEVKAGTPIAPPPGRPSRHVGPGLPDSLNGRLGLRQLVPSPRAGLFEDTANDPLEELVRQTAEDLHFRQTRSPGQELVKESRHMRQGRDLASWVCSGSGLFG